MYKLSPAQDDLRLFFRMDGEAAERHGAIGYLRADFGRNGDEFHATWFDSKPRLKTPVFRNEFDCVFNNLRESGPEPPLANRVSLQILCVATPGKELDTRGHGYMIRTEDYSHYFRCRPSTNDYDIYCFVYDNRFLLPELVGQHELPEQCYSVLPSSRALILLVRGEKSYEECADSQFGREANRMFADMANELNGVTRAQEEAMLNGSIFGWNAPAAKPWNYDQDGTPRQLPKKNEPER